MRSWTLVLAAGVLLAASSPGNAADDPSAPADGGGVVRWEDFEDPGFDPAATPAGGAAGAESDGQAPASAPADPAEPADQLVEAAEEAAPVAQEAAPPAETAGPESAAAEPAEGGAPSAPNAAEVEASNDWVEDWDSPVDETEAAGPVAARSVALGPEGVDSDGQRGRIHLVVPGDTLWDITDAYLGTPWVWPSVWDENEEIENPHLIIPGDRIWIAAGKMRRVSAAEAERMMAAAQSGEPAPSGEPIAIAQEPDSDVPSSMDALPVTIPLRASDGGSRGELQVNWREGMSFVSRETLEAATSVVESPTPRLWLAQGDLLFVGLGEGQVKRGDQFTVFRDAAPVYDAVQGDLLGYHIDVLGWVEVKEIDNESSVAEVMLSVAEMERGDKLIPRQVLSPKVKIRTAKEPVDAWIVYMPSDRTLAGSADYVYLNRGSVHGLEEGTGLEVYESGTQVRERTTGSDVRTPDTHIADLVVIATQPEVSVAIITHTTRELAVGDRVRQASLDVAAAAPAR